MSEIYKVTEEQRRANIFNQFSVAMEGWLGHLYAHDSQDKDQQWAWCKDCDWQMDGEFLETYQAHQAHRRAIKREIVAQYFETLTPGS